MAQLYSTAVQHSCTCTISDGRWRDTGSARPLCAGQEAWHPTAERDMHTDRIR